MEPCKHDWEEKGFGSLGNLGLTVWWWQCTICGLWCWHQKGSLTRAIASEHFERAGPKILSDTP